MVPALWSLSSAVFGRGDGHLEQGYELKNPSCAIGICGYVGCMNWQQFLPLVIVLVAVVLFVWRSSDKKSGNCGCPCGCSHEPGSPPKKEDAAR
jgi:hypothetical protein